MWLQNIAVVEREDDSSTSSEESGEESDDDISDSRDSDTGSAPLDEPKDVATEQTAHGCQLPTLRMPKTSRKRKLQPCVEVLRSSDSNTPDASDDKRH